jgi:hypothetical protein
VYAILLHAQTMLSDNSRGSIMLHMPRVMTCMLPHRSSCYMGRAVCLCV